MNMKDHTAMTKIQRTLMLALVCASMLLAACESPLALKEYLVKSVAEYETMNEDPTLIIPTVSSASAETDSNTPTWTWERVSGATGYRYQLDSEAGTWTEVSATTFSFTPATALSAGTHTLNIQARNAAGAWTSTGKFVITITSSEAPVAVTGIALNKSSTAVLAVSGTERLFAYIVPLNATNLGFTWSTTDDTVATVGTDGLVTAKAAGTATILVSSSDGGFTAMCRVTVSAMDVPVESIALNKNTASILMGGAEQLYVTITPPGATDQNLDWTSSDPAIATVSAGGVVTAKALGTATISAATVVGGKTATCNVTIARVPATPVAVTGISIFYNAVSISTLTLVAGGPTKTLTATLSPADATNQNVSWVSSNTAVAQVGLNSGVVLPVTAGSATITATTQDGGKTAMCAVTVTANTLSTNADLSDLTLSTGTLSPVFSASTTNYTMTVPYAVLSITATGTKADSLASVGGQSGQLVSLIVGSNLITITVTAESGTTKDYKVTVTRSAASTNADLSALTVSGASLNEVFSPETTSYTVNVPSGTSTATITGTKAEAHSSVAYDPSSNPVLAVGPNTVTVTVTAESGAAKAYTLTITRATWSGVKVASATESLSTTSTSVAVSGSEVYICFQSTPDGHLMLAKSLDAGATFTTSTVASVSCGPDSDIVVSGSVLLIIYQDLTNNIVKIARSPDKGNTWTFPDLDATLGLGQYSSIACYGSAVYVSYYNVTKVWQAKSADLGLVWSTPTFASDNANFTYSSISAEGSIIAIGSYNGSSSRDSYCDVSINSGSSFTLRPVEIMDDVGSFPSVAVKNSKIYMSYYHYDYVSEKDLMFARSDASPYSSWTKVPVDTSAGVGKYSSIAVSGAKVYISYWDETNNRLKIAKSADSGATWTKLTVGSYDSGSSTAIALTDSGSTVYIAYKDIDQKVRIAKSLDGGATW